MLHVTSVILIESHRQKTGDGKTGKADPELEIERYSVMKTELS